MPKRNRLAYWRELLGEKLRQELIEQAYREARLPTVTVIIYPQCEAIVERRLPGFKHCRPKEEACGVKGARYLIVGELGTVEQNLCPAHRKQAGKAHKEWMFTELKRAIRKETREVAENAHVMTVRRQYGVVEDDIPNDDESIPF